MPDLFEPRFVDLVRNYSTTQGSGNLVLGAAVNGFTSFANAVQATDTFYYSVVGVDKPAEREVGRGTMQSNGTIARQAIEGPLTNFSSGTKIVALVAAAEWFNRIEAGSSAGSSGAPVAVATRTALAALPTTDVAILREPGREGLFVFDSSNLSSRVAADTRQGIYVAPTTGPTGASGAWVRRFDGPLNVRWFGCAANLVTDDLAAFDCALSVIRAQAQGGFPGGNKLFVPAGQYYLSSTLNLHTCVHLFGAGSAQANASSSQATLLRFGKNANGIVINEYRTHGNGLGSQGDAGGSVIEGLQLWGGNVNVDGSGNVSSYRAGDSTTGHGVRIRAVFVACKDVMASFFGGSGFNINATSGSAGATQGNANSFTLDRCIAIYNRGHGIEISGSDANAGTTITCSSIDNGGCGIIDYSFLGNTHIQPHVRDCGVDDPTSTNKAGPTGACLHSGAYYYVVAGQEAAASTTTPGTNSAVWRTFAGHPRCKTWSSGLTWVVGAPYATNPSNVNARNVFLGAYGESAQPPVQASYPSLFLGGLLEEVGFDVSSSAPWQRAGSFSLHGPSYRATHANAFLGENNNANVWTGMETGAAGGTIRLKKQTIAGGEFARCDINNSDNAVPYLIGMANAADPAAMHVAKLYVGSAAGGAFDGRRLQFIGSVADLNGKSLNRGDLFLYLNPAPGGKVGTVCTTAGTGGSSAILREFGQIIGNVTSQAGTAYTAGLGDADGYIRFTSGSAVSFTVPANSAVAFPLGTTIEFEQAGAGGLTVVAASGVTVNVRGADLSLAGQYAIAALKKVGADIWTLTGDL